jgi:hypothetical protein
MTELADNGLFESMLAVHVEDAKDEDARVVKRKRKIDVLHRKSLERNKRKKEAHKKLSKQERQSKIPGQLSKKLKAEVNVLEQKCLAIQEDYKKEKQISKYCWRKWKIENKVNQRLTKT